MVTLFVRLYAAAGVRAPKPVAARAATPRIRAQAQKLPAVRTRVRPQNLGPGPSVYEFPKAGGLPAPIEGLLATLPDEGTGWTKDRRDKFVTTFEAVLDFCFPIVSTALVPADGSHGGGQPMR